MTTSCDWCGKKDDDPIKPQDDDLYPAGGAR
jgi:hypothetical protein